MNGLTLFGAAAVTVRPPIARSGPPGQSLQEKRSCDGKGCPIRLRKETMRLEFADQPATRFLRRRSGPATGAHIEVSLTYHDRAGVSHYG
jgi:hypothetical protein